MRLARRILTWGVAVLGAVVIGLVGSVVFDYAVGGDRLSAVTNVTIPGAGGSPAVRAYVARPTGAGPRPVVIMIHEFYGLNSSIVGKADLLAKEGYIVVAPDTMRGQTTEWIPRAIYQTLTTRPEDINADLDSVFAWIKAQPDADSARVATAGFCFGGRASLMYSLHNPVMAATVVFYGAPETDPAKLKVLRGPTLGMFGGADSTIPLDQVEAFRKGLTEAGVRNTVSVYDGEPHAFVHDAAGIAAGGAQGKAWTQMTDFLKENLQGTRASAPDPDGATSSTSPTPLSYLFALAYEHSFGMGGHGHGHG